MSGSKVELLAYIKDKLKSKLSGCYAKSLSIGRKEILLKSVALALPVFAMSCFKLPKTICDNLTSAMSTFWWSSLEHKKKISWVSWENLCLSKEQGGIGFRDIQRFNQALLAKQAWRLIQNPASLFSRVFKSHYFEETHLFDAVLGKRPSYAWRSICYGRELIMAGSKLMVGNGKSLYVWSDPWLDDEEYKPAEIRPPWRKNRFFDVNLKVSSLIDRRRKCWKIEKLDDLFFEDDIARILKRKPVVNRDDFWSWKHTKSGNYSVKSGYWLACRLFNKDAIERAECQPSLNDLKAAAWKEKTAPKIQTFIWRALSGAISAAERLESRGLSVDNRCQDCGVDGESINHLLFLCDAARQIWALSGIPIPCNGYSLSSIYTNIQYLFGLDRDNRIPVDIRRSWPWILWFIWKNRNAFIFEGKKFLPPDTITKIREEATSWFLAQELLSLDVIQQKSAHKFTPLRWLPPSAPYVKCNIGVVWSKKEKSCGAAWVVRDCLGAVIMHSRRCFAGIENSMMATIITVAWAMDALITHKFSNVVFAFEDADLVEAINKPHLWPTLVEHTNIFLKGLRYFLDWEVIKERPASNRGASMVAKSALQIEFSQSYVSSGQPLWLNDLFSQEKITLS